MKQILKHIAYINPSESIVAGSIAKKVAMDRLQPFCRDIPDYELAKYNGGTKFRNGDTIMAKITPCLENGKTAKVNILEVGEVGFGSTEYIVFRAIPGITNEDYLYYLICSPLVRDPAIKSMVGSSGRQRVQIDVVQNLEIEMPDLETQKRIGTMLKALDDKIELNNQINNNLAEQIQAIYRQGFDPTTHQPTGSLSDICHYSLERVSISVLSVSTYYSTENMQPNKAGAINAASLPTISQTTKCHKGDVLISNIRPYFKKIVYVSDDCGCSTDVLCLVPNDIGLSAFLFSTVFADRFFDYMVAGSKGTKMPRGDKQQIMKYPVVLPSGHALMTFTDTVKPMLEIIANNRAEIVRLADIRDVLLPRLMSGELDVSQVEV